MYIFMETKVCTQCGEEKTINSFAWKNKKKNRRHSECKECHKKYDTKHYNRKKEYYLEKARKHKEKVRKWFVNFKRDKKCIECGESHPACFVFHHRDSSKKEISIGNAIRMGWGIERLKKEIEKCDILCANCHRKEHWKGKV